MRDHSPVTIDQFNGLWARDDIEETPMDHFSEANNLNYRGSNGFGNRDGVGIHQDVVAPLGNILRFYNYPTQDRNTLLVLVAGGSIFHVLDSTTVFGPILTIANMTDFGFVPYNGRAYITPFTTEVVGTMNRERGLQNEFLYVYKGDGTAARKAAGVAPTGIIAIANGAAGFTDAGTHVFGVVFETDTGYLSEPGALNSFVTSAGLSVSFSSVPTSPNPAVTKRHIVASKVIQTFNGDLTGYQLFFIPGATIPNNVGTTLSNISFFDADLLLDASHLVDNFAEIGAGVRLFLYHNRLCLTTQYDNISIVRVSAPGEPEAINEINGFCLMPPNGDPITSGDELRDIMYVMKRNKTGAFTDNGDVPTTWPYTQIDPAMGCGVHGLGTVVDSGGSNIDYFLVGTYTGVALFNGRYILPELSHKVAGLWANQTFKTDNRRIQILNDSVDQRLYIILTDRRILFGDYGNGFSPDKVRWSPWTFDFKVNTLALINVNELIIGADQV